VIPFWRCVGDGDVMVMVMVVGDGRSGDVVALLWWSCCGLGGVILLWWFFFQDRECSYVFVGMPKSSSLDSEL
jgi:hypothetical protein